MTTFEARGAPQRLAEEKLKGRVALVAGGGRGIGTAIGRGLGGRVGRREGVARVAHVPCAGTSSSIAGRAWALDGSREM